MFKNDLDIGTLCLYQCCSVYQSIHDVGCNLVDSFTDVAIVREGVRVEQAASYHVSPLSG